MLNLFYYCACLGVLLQQYYYKLLHESDDDYNSSRVPFLNAR
jgi:hypothetical protein